MFGGGAKKEKKEDDDDRGDNSGSAKAQRDAAAAAKDGDDVSVAFEIPQILKLPVWAAPTLGLSAAIRVHC